MSIEFTLASLRTPWLYTQEVSKQVQKKLWIAYTTFFNEVCI
ncbi:hypothetical protein [Algibacter mikhailovii]|nr:hypothetical protein [Algibacter mikhailovii]